MRGVRCWPEKLPHPWQCSRLMVVSLDEEGAQSQPRVLSAGKVEGRASAVRGGNVPPHLPAHSFGNSLSSRGTAEWRKRGWRKEDARQESAYAWGQQHMYGECGREEPLCGFGILSVYLQKLCKVDLCMDLLFWHKMS